MTIGIGVLCSTKRKPHHPRPDALILIADTMGSTETDSTSELHKMFMYPDTHLFGVCADKVEVAAELVPTINDLLTKIEGPRRHGNIWRALNDAVYGHRRERFLWDVVNPQFAPMGTHQVLQQEQDRLMEAWRRYDVRAQLLLGIFDEDGLALLYFIGPVEGVEGLVHLCEFPGHAAIGAGLYNASVWLNYRQQTLGLSVEQSALHAYEASRMASSAPSVNKDIEILVATKQNHFRISGEEPTVTGCPVSLPWLKNMAKKYGPRSTNELGFGAHPSKSTSSAKDQT